MATVAVLAGGCAAMAAGMASRRSAGLEVGGRERRDVAPWAALAAATGVWQLAAYVQHPRDNHPTLSSLANSLLDSSAPRAVAFAVWLAGAWALSRR